MADRPRRRIAVRIAIAGIVVLFFFALSLTRFYTDYLWFQEVELAPVLWKSLGTQFGLGALVAVGVGLLVWANLLIAARLAPSYRVATAGAARDPFERYRTMLAPLVKWIRVGVAAFVGIVSGAAAAPAWRLYLLWANREEFGTVDPQFGRDASFYLFDLPLYDEAVGWLWSALMAALVLSAVAHLFHGSLRLPPARPPITSGALAHLSVLLGALAIVKAFQYRLGQYFLNFSPRGVVDGASYTDVHAQLPALKLLVIISVISAVLFLVNIRVRRVALPIAAVGIWIFTAIVAGGIWPAVVQRFSVDPQELQRERPYIERNIAATRVGFGLDDVITRSFPASSSLSAETIGANENILNNVRLWDPEILARANEQLQAIRLYYTFWDVDIDRYEVDGALRQVLISARELSLEQLEERSQTWSNEHLQFTHGYGIVASFTNEATVAGQPQYIVRDVPGIVRPGAESLAVDQGAIYYGEAFAPGQYSVVNSDQEELDYPTEEGVQRSQYAGRGGIELSSPLRRLAFAFREGETNLLLSGLINTDSRILIYRNVRDRVLRAAPFLALDHDPYVTVVDGRLLWVLDAYTTSPWFPYSQRFDASEIIPAGVGGTLTGEINYIRNSVKVVVDAYDGTMTFYVVDESDPIIRAWRKAFPEIFTDAEPPAELRAHFRYPEDLFDVQSDVYLTYHMDDAADFYSKEDAWSLPPNPQVASASDPDALPGTYLLTRLPGETEEEFLILRPATPRGKNNMVSVMVGRSDPGVYGEFVTFIFPRQRLIPGPVQVNTIINQDPAVSEARTLLGQQGSRFDFGRLIILPIADSILYIQPIFVTAEDVGIPELKRVAVVLGEEVAFAETLDEALLELFGVIEPEPDPEPTETPGPDEEPAEDRTLGQLIAQAVKVYEQAQDALQAGNFEEYGRLIERLGRLLQEASEFSGRR